MRKRGPGRRAPNPSFYITGKGIVNVRFSYRGSRLSISLQRQIDPKEWSKKKQGPKISSLGRKDLVRLKADISKWENAIHMLFRDVGESMTPEQFKQEILYRVGEEQRPGDLPSDLHGYIAAFIELYKQTPGRTRTSFGKFEALQRHLQQFEKDTKQQLNWQSLDFQFKADFTNWMFAPPRSFSNNNAAKIMASLRQVMRDAFRKKVHTGTIQEDREFTVRRLPTNGKVRLTVPELYKIEHLELEEGSNHDKARDLMIFACWTGLRISDWAGITRANFRTRKGETFLELVTSKTKTHVIIPVLPQVDRIFEKYNYQLPELVHQVFNRLIKDVCKLAIPDATFSRVYSEGGITKKEFAPKWEYVSSHSGRKSFASNMYEETGVAYPIMQITGHSTESIFHKYIDIQKSETVRTMYAPALKLANWQPK